MKKMDRAVRGMNRPNEPKVTMAAKERGMITDGVSLEKGYKVVSGEGSSPHAVPQNTGGKG